MRVVVISLDRSPARLAAIGADLSRLGIAFQHFRAVDGATLSAADRAAFASARPGCGLFPGEIGCYLSHRAIWQALVNGPDEWACVLEDDATISRALGEFLANFPSATPAALINLETRNRSVELSPPIMRTGQGEFRRLKSRHVGTAGYVVHRHAAEVLLRETEHEPEPIDVIFNRRFLNLPDLLVIQMVPAMVTHSDAPTDIGLQRRPARKPRRGALRDLGRSVERQVRIIAHAIRAWRGHLRVGPVPFADV